MVVVSKLAVMLGRRRGLIAAIAVVVWLILKRQRSKAKSSKTGKAKAIPPAERAKKVIWSIIWPKLFAPGREGQGTLEVIAMGVLNLWRLSTIYRFVKIVTWGDALIVSRKKVEWRRFIWQFACIGIETQTVEETLRYLRRRLALIFRQKLLANIYDKYFQSMTYYHVEQKIKDVDVCITEDVATIADGFADYTGSLVLSCLTSGFYLTKILYEYGLLYAGTPFVYIVGCGILVGKFAPTDWSLFGKLEYLKGAYRSQHTRLVLNNEAVAALRGGAMEERILMSGLDSMMKMQERVHDAVLMLTKQTKMWFEHGIGFMLALWVLGPGVFTPPTPAGDIDAIAKTRGTVGYQFMVNIQIVVGAFELKNLNDQFKKIGGNCTRIVELLDALQVDPGSHLQEGAQLSNEIEFESVDIKTPTDVELVRGLSFKVQSNCDSLLLTGHNGAGKSSIFRCLAGLWRTSTGTIKKPEGGLAGAVFYLPQKPYNVLGTLQAQLTYPANSNTSEMTQARVREVLKVVGLEYLVDRPGVFTEEVNWEQQLSLGEQQRLAIARLVFSKPSFAILDECTSALSREMESKLYQILWDMKVSYITISHRPILRAVHSKLLFLKGDDEKGYDYEEINSSSKLDNYFKEQRKEDTEMNAMADVDDFSVKDQIHLRSKPYSGNAVTQAKANISTVSRLWRLLSLASIPNWRLKILGLVGSLAAKVGLRLLQQIRVQYMFQALFKRDKGLFLRMALYGILHQIFAVMVDCKMLKLEQTLQRGIKEGLSKNLIRRYVKVNGYYMLPAFNGESHGKIKDPETRLTDDIQALANMTADLALKATLPVLELICLGTQLFKAAGEGSASLYAWLFTATMITRLIMPNFKSLTSQQSEATGKHKFWHSRIRTHAESIAFFGGGQSEQEGAMRQFEEVVRLQQRRNRLDWGFNLIRGILMERISGVFMNRLRFNFAATQYADDESILIDGGAAVTSKQHIIWDTNESLRKGVTELVNVMDRCSSFAGLIQRISELDERISHEESKQAADASLLASQSTATSSKDVDSTTTSKDSSVSLKLADVDIVTPDGSCLARRINVEAHQQSGTSFGFINVPWSASALRMRQRMVITGPNACGKTALFRLLAGLWPLHKGAINVDGKIMFVPQKPYSVSGTLLDQVLYPDCLPVPSLNEAEELISKRKASEIEARELLKLVGIEYLIDRWAEQKEGAEKKSKDGEDNSGWYATQQWEQTLSLGEQQRLGIARMMQKHPDFAVLDECTDAVSVDVERRLYQTCVDRNINIVTISKRLTLEEFHEIELRLGEVTEDGCSVYKI